MEQKIFIHKTEEQVLYELKGMPGAYFLMAVNIAEQVARFMAFCTGKKTLPVLYDTVFKKLMNPDLHPERLEDCISCLLKERVTIQTVLPMEDILMDGESTMVMDRYGLRTVPWYWWKSKRFLTISRQSGHPAIPQTCFSANTAV